MRIAMLPLAAVLALFSGSGVDNAARQHPAGPMSLSTDLPLRQLTASEVLVAKIAGRPALANASTPLQEKKFSRMPPDLDDGSRV